MTTGLAQPRARPRSGRERLTVTFVTPRYTPYIGGVEVHVEEIAKRVAAMGHSARVFTHEHEKGLKRRELLDGVDVRRFPVPVPSQNFGFSPALWAALRDDPASLGIVHAHAYHALPALGAALFKRTPLVFTPHYHGTGHSRFRTLLHPPYRYAGRHIFRQAERVVCVSAAERRLVESHFPEVSDRITVLHNGVDVDRVRAASPFPLDDGQRLILSAGRLEDYKQVHLAVKAMAHLPANYQLRVTGDGPARPGLERLVGDLGLGERVRLLGRVSDEDLYRWFRTACVYTSLSSNEAFPITPMEALTAGARVVASDIPAHREVQAATGGAMRLVPLQVEPALLAREMESLADEPAGEARVLSWDDVAEAVIDVYEEASSLATVGAVGRH